MRKGMVGISLGVMEFGLRRPWEGKTRKSEGEGCRVRGRTQGSLARWPHRSRRGRQKRQWPEERTRVEGGREGEIVWDDEKERGIGRRG